MRRVLVVPVAAAALLLTACTPTVSMAPAPQATTVGCAGVVVRMPESIGTAARRTTDAQGTAAWGTPASVTLTCGVRTPVVATSSCTTIDGVDWLLQERSIDGAPRQVFTTYGRNPTTQLVVDVSAVTADSVLQALSDPIGSATKRTDAKCLSVSETS
jgi:hypothetical protein